MANSDNSSASIRSNLTKIYQQLPPKKKQMVQLFSVIYGPVSRTDFLSCLTPCAIKNEDDKAFNGKTLKLYLDNLIDLGVLIQEKGKGPQCHPLLVEIVTRDAIKSGCFELFVKMSQQQLFNNRYVRYGWENWDFLRKVRIAVYRQKISMQCWKSLTST